MEDNGDSGWERGVEKAKSGNGVARSRLSSIIH